MRNEAWVEMLYFLKSSASRVAGGLAKSAANHSTRENYHHSQRRTDSTQQGY